MSRTTRSTLLTALVLEVLPAAGRRGIESSLLAGHVEPMYLVPAGPGADPAPDAVTCPGLTPAGNAAVHPDGLFEVVRCVTARGITALQAIGEDTSHAERHFADAEAARLDDPPDLRGAVELYARALERLARGH